MTMFTPEFIVTNVLVIVIYFTFTLFFAKRLFRYQGSEVPVLPKNRKVKICSFGCDTMWPDTLVLAGRLGHYKTGLCSGEGPVGCK